MQLNKKTIVITGASSGIGATLAKRASLNGASVVLAARTESKLLELASDINSCGGTALAIPTDITDSEQCENLVKETIDTFEKLDVLVLNAGISMWSDFESIKDVQFFQSLIDINYMGAVHCVKSALPHLKKNQGLIAQMSTAQALMGFPEHTGYAASKHALQGFLASLEIEMKGMVRFLHIYLGWIRGTNLRQNAFNLEGLPMGTQKRSHNKESIEVDECAQSILTAIKTGKQKMYLPSKLKWIPLLNAVCPRFLQYKVSQAVDNQSQH